jgi:DnaK suppressor protein
MRNLPSANSDQLPKPGITARKHIAIVLTHGIFSSSAPNSSPMSFQARLLLRRTTTMDSKAVTKFKKKLLEEKQRLMNNAQGERDLSIATDDLADDSDHTSAEMTASVTFSLLEKEKNSLREIDEALLRMEEGTYGHCEECDADIGARRLEVFPTARFCVQHQEEQEKRKKLYVA